MSGYRNCRWCALPLTWWERLRGHDTCSDCRRWGR